MTDLCSKVYLSDQPRGDDFNYYSCLHILNNRSSYKMIILLFPINFSCVSVEGESLTDRRTIIYLKIHIVVSSLIKTSSMVDG